MTVTTTCDDYDNDNDNDDALYLNHTGICGISLPTSACRSRAPAPSTTTTITTTTTTEILLEEEQDRVVFELIVQWSVSCYIFIFLPINQSACVIQTIARSTSGGIQVESSAGKN